MDNQRFMILNPLMNALAKYKLFSIAAKLLILQLLLLSSFKSSAAATAWVSTTVTQTSVSVFRGSTDSRGVTGGVSGALQVIQIDVLTANDAGTAVNITTVTCNTNGTTAVTNLTNAKLYTTGTSAVFSTATPYGSTIANPNGVMTFNGSVSINANAHSYFWLTYDISSSATVGNVVDAECNSIIINGLTKATVTSAPAGARSITNIYIVSLLTDGTITDGTSLRWAITETNLNSSADIINFNLGGAGGPFVIQLNTLLPNIATDNNGVTIDGFTNTGNDGTPGTRPVNTATVALPMNPIYKVKLGNNNNLATGLIITSNNNIIKGLVLQDFGDNTPSANDIAITISGNNNQVVGCNIGVEETGVTSGTKTYIGISISGANNTVGSGSAQGANIISGFHGAQGAGILLTGAGCTGNTVKGNMLGLSGDGTTPVGTISYSYGIYITNGATSNTIGGAGANDGNIISGNPVAGLYIDSGTGANTVIGNTIGPRADGITIVTGSTQVTGIVLSNTPNNTIGGNSTTGYKNIISGNASTGLRITGATTTGNIIKGNYIGIAGNGTAYIAGQDTGISISITPASNTMGSSTANEGNVISGNDAYGIYILSTAAAGNIIIGNTIGPQSNGTACLVSSNQDYGIYLNNSRNNLIGGNGTTGYKNILTGNISAGMAISGASSTGNVVKGNYIGLAGTGTALLSGGCPVQNSGIIITSSAASNTIGSTTANEENVISGNSNYGIESTSTGAAGNTFIGNIIGTQKNGNTAVASSSQNYGIYLATSPNNSIGGNSTTGYRNIISGNTSSNILIWTTGSTGNLIKGNYIGIAGNGTGFIAGQGNGIEISTGAASNTIGSITANEGNVISGQNSGIVIAFAGAAGNLIIGNIIGPQSDGATFLGSSNQVSGIWIRNSPNNIIGGNSTTGYKNIISGNGNKGIFIEGAASTGNVVKGNYIGTAGNGTSLIGGSNQDYGITIESSAASNTIGSATANEGNVISGNTTDGIFISNSGIANVVKGNYIGTDYTGTVNLGNTGDGISFWGTSSSNSIGGTTGGEPNIIAYNGSDGISVNAAGTHFNSFRRNSIFCNTSKGINLNGIGNDNITTPVITTVSTAGASGIAGTVAANATVELFYGHACAGCQGKTYIGSTTADGAGAWSYVGALASGPGQQLVITQTSTTNNTSEFSACNLWLPIELISFNAKKINHHQVLTEWVTATETNNNYFTLEKSKEGINWEMFGTVKGAGNSSQKLNYFLVDEHPFSGISYYRLKQTDYDGKFVYSQLESVNFEASETSSFSIYPNPINSTSSDLSLTLSGLQPNSSTLVVLRDVFGKEYYSKVVLTENNGSASIILESSMPLSPGVYLIISASNNQLISRKIVVQ